jgi:cytochrome b561
MRLHDTPTGYGWVSILLHWLLVVVILALLFVGDSIEVGGDHMLRLHTSIAVTFYILIAVRIWWRLKEGHPGPLPGQEGWSFILGKIVHYILIAATGVMLFSGPIMAWSGEMPVRLFDLLTIPSPFDANPALFEVALEVHKWGAITIAVGTFLHIGGVIKHTIWNRDHTLVKMIIPAKAPADPGARTE